MSIVGLVPLRAGGKRVGLINGLDKERAILGRHPLLAYTIRHAIDSGVFDAVIAVTASEMHVKSAEAYGADSIIRPDYTVGDRSPDIEWVNWLFSDPATKEKYDAFAILRVTSPFRSANTIIRAWDKFRTTPGAQSLRAVRRVTEHPGKMWVIRHGRMLPLLPMGDPFQPWHSSPTQDIFDCYIQTAGLEFAWTEVVRETRTIAGSVVLPWVLEGPEALDINTRDDWHEAVALVEAGLVELPASLK